LLLADNALMTASGGGTLPMALLMICWMYLLGAEHDTTQARTHVTSRARDEARTRGRSQHMRHTARARLKPQAHPQTHPTHPAQQLILYRLL
jgi:hypothetical protein